MNLLTIQVLSPELCLERFRIDFNLIESRDWMSTEQLDLNPIRYLYTSRGPSITGIKVG